MCLKYEYSSPWCSSFICLDQWEHYAFFKSKKKSWFEDRAVALSFVRIGQWSCDVKDRHSNKHHFACTDLEKCCTISLPLSYFSLYHFPKNIHHQIEESVLNRIVNFMFRKIGWTVENQEIFRTPQTAVNISKSVGIWHIPLQKVRGLNRYVQTILL